MRPKQTLSERFFSKVEKRRSGCWEWTGTVMKNGYGQLWAEGRKEYAHRVSVKLFKGPIEGSMCVCHRCDNRKCVNPEHLFVGSQADNMADMVAKGRSNIGEKNGNSKLSDGDIIRIRNSQGEPLNTVAARFGVSAPLVSMIQNRKIWTHLGELPGETP